MNVSLAVIRRVFAPFSDSVRTVVSVGAVALLCSGIVATTGRALTVEITGENVQKHATCNGGLTPGGTDLFDIGTISFVGGGGSTQDILSALGNQYPVDESGMAWAYSAASSELGGNLIVDWYKAYDREQGSYCRHGAQLSLHYNRFDGDPLDLRWIQVYTETGDAGSHVNEVDGKGDLSPGYFNPSDDPNRYVYVHDTGGLLFGDTPGDPHLESRPFNGSVAFTAFLASFDNNNVTIYEGITWGYQFTCVPEPGTYGLFGGAFLLVVVVAVRRLRRKG